MLNGALEVCTAAHRYFFALGFAPFLEWVSELCSSHSPGGIPFAFADDLSGVGSPITLLAVLDRAERTPGDLTGLRVNWQKVRPLPPPDPSPSTRSAPPPVSGVAAAAQQTAVARL